MVVSVKLCDEATCVWNQTYSFVALNIEAAATIGSVASWLQIFCHELCIHLS